MTAISFKAFNIWMLGSNQRLARAPTWHLRTVIMPRRTITGRLVRGPQLLRGPCCSVLLPSRGRVYGRTAIAETIQTVRGGKTAMTKRRHIE
jgi:hypothetical protein